MSSPESRIPLNAMTLQEQVAIALGLPLSGTAWLDAMLEAKLRMDFEKLQYQQVCTLPEATVLQPGPFIDEALERGQFTLGTGGKDDAGAA